MPQPAIPGHEDPPPLENRPDDVAVQAFEMATAPARWLLNLGADGSVALTATYALARAVVREAAERWPDWWNAELFGPPHREDDLAVLGALHDGLRRLKLVRRRARKLHITARGRELADDAAALLRVLIADLGRGDPFTETVAATVTGKLAARAPCEHDDLVASAIREARRGGWRNPDGQAPTERDVSWVVSEVLCRGEAYGVIERRPDSGQSRFHRSQIVLTGAARVVLGLDSDQFAGTVVLVFDAELLNARGVRARLAVGVRQHLTALHDAIQEAFGWYDDHLYSFWIDGELWGDENAELARPGTPDEAPQTADVPLAELDLAIGAKIAYVFDYGDEWRVRLILRQQTEPDGGVYPRVLKREGTPPSQYPEHDQD
jgi:hypothetical protein